jgi:hypothetical protein
MKYLLNYAHLNHYYSQKRQTESARIGGFDQVFQCSFEDIDGKFYEKNKSTLDMQKGAGCWLWKPYLILKHLKNLTENDFLFYLDSGALFIDRIDPLEKICQEQTNGVLCFHLNEGPYLIEHNYDCYHTKRDIYIAMNCDNESYWYSYIINAAMSGWIKNKFTLNFLEEWLYFAQKDGIITDSPSLLGPELPLFRANRHDQSIFSVLRKKYNLPSFTDPSQYGNQYRAEQGNTIPQIIDHHRDSN